MGRLGKKSQRNHGELYAETKSLQVILSMTPTGKTALDQLAVSLSLSRSELVEQLARNLLDLHQVGANLSKINTQKI
jgi:DNA-binding TFAR19-related protein (PDSD5 family)